MTQLIGVGDFRTCWAAYYNQQQRDEYFAPPIPRQGKQGPVKLLSHGCIPQDQHICGRHIDDLKSDRDGVCDSVVPESAVTRD